MPHSLVAPAGPDDLASILLNQRIQKFLGELGWMVQVLRAGRDEVALDAAAKVACWICGTPMNHHAEKIDHSSGDGGVLHRVNQCPRCGNVELRAIVAAAVH
jgi:hypothetical protein